MKETSKMKTAEELQKLSPEKLEAYLTEITRVRDAMSMHAKIVSRALDEARAKEALARAKR